MKALSRMLHELFVGAISFFLVVRGPFERGFSTSQVLGLSFFGFMLITHVHRNRKARFGPRAVYMMLTVCGLLLAFALSLLIGSMRGTTDLHQGIRDFRDYSIFAVIAVACVFDSNIRKRSPITAAMVGGGLAILLELATRGTSFYPKVFYEPFLGYRYTAGFSSPNEYGAFCSIILTMAIGQSLQTKSSYKTVGLMCIAVVASIAGMSSFSRGSMLGAAIAVFVMSVSWIIDSRRSDNRLQSVMSTCGLLLTMVAGITAIGIVLPAILGLNWKTTVLYRFQEDIRSVDLLSRGSLAAAALRIGMEYPLLGAGLGAFSSQSAVFMGAGTLSPHNELAKSFAEAGILGCLLTGMLLIEVLLQAFSRRKMRGGYAVLGGSLAFIISEQLFSHLVRPSLSLIFAIIVGAASTPDNERRHP